MNVLIIGTNQSVFPMPVMPIGACMVAEAAERAGHKVSVLDLMFERDPVRAIASALRKSNPDVMGLSVRNIDNNDMRGPMFYIPGLSLLVQSIRSRTEVPIVLEQPHEFYERRFSQLLVPSRNPPRWISAGAQGSALAAHALHPPGITVCGNGCVKNRFAIYNRQLTTQTKVSAHGKDIIVCQYRDKTLTSPHLRSSRRPTSPTRRRLKSSCGIITRTD